MLRARRDTPHLIPKIRHIALWLGVVGVIALAFFLKHDISWSGKNIWKFVVLPLSICLAWTLAAIGWVCHGRIQSGPSCPSCRYRLDGHQAPVTRCPECGLEVPPELREQPRLRVLHRVLLTILTLGCVAVLFVVAAFLALASSADC